MVWVWRILEKILVYIIFVFVSFFISFSFITGHFPPRKDDLAKSYHLMSQLFKKHNELTAAQREQGTGEAGVNFEQMVKIQELGLERTKIAHELSKVIAVFPQGIPDQELFNQIQEVSKHLQAADMGMEKIQAKMQEIGKPAQNETH